VIGGQLHPSDDKRNFCKLVGRLLEWSLCEVHASLNLEFDKLLVDEVHITSSGIPVRNNSSTSEGRVTTV
jgi:hypothetical protein